MSQPLPHSISRYLLRRSSRSIRWPASKRGGRGTGQRMLRWRTIAVRMSCPLRCGARPRRVVSTSGSSGMSNYCRRDCGRFAAAGTAEVAESLAGEAASGGCQQALRHLAGKVELQLFVRSHQDQLGLLLHDTQLERAAIAERT